MASGKLSPRQKMINMMYLVLTALLALNISKDILNALTKLNASLDQTVQNVDAKNASIYLQLEKAAENDPKKAGPFVQQANEVKKASDELYTYISKLKKDLVEASGGWDKDNPDVPRNLDQREKPANFLLNQGEATKLKQKVADYRQTVMKYTENPEIESTIQNNFDTGDQPIGTDGTKASWEKANFEHYPLAAILPFLTDYQAKVRNTETSIISELQSRITLGDIKISDVQAIAVPKSTYITQGDQYEAEVFLIAYDATQKPEIVIEGNPLPEDQISSGRGIIKFPANKVGEHKWGGKITIKQLEGEKTYDIPVQTYTVAPPSVVISPTKMNVLYRGVTNPIEIGVPGVDPSKIRVSGPGVSGSGGQYAANVSNVNSSEITISVSVEETSEDGKKSTRSVGSKVFRVKDLPPAVGTILRRNTGQLSAGLIKSSPVEATLENFPFDLALTVTGFEVVIPGFPPERVSGNTMPSAVKTRIDQMRPGQTITIRDIRATANGVRVPKVAAISIDVN